jgi:valyl-tRNA synthetase
MTDRLSKTYNPKDHEERLYKWWEEQGYFRPEKQVELGLAMPDGPRWCITLPPPNVTGALHLGHAMVAAVEDLMTRYNRMKGRQTLFLPGSDHAGIATQNVVERELRKEGLTRHDLGREKFIERVWEWKRVYHARISEQTRRLGMSCDWTRERFTLDEDLSRAVRTAFVRLYDKGLIYRGTYLVNWCPRCTSAISDLEVIPEERDSHLWHVRYPVIDKAWDGPKGEWGSGQWAAGATEFIQMATTRPETILGDTAVAVNPNDPRWQPFVGKTAVLPALGRHLPIIADESVDPEFGTGAVKVTPAHDPTDYEMGQRHNLEAVNVMSDTATMNQNAGPYAGQDRFECRRAIVADFEKEGLLVKVEPYFHAVGTCERCHTDVEPRISTQWFVNVKPLAEAAMAAVHDRRTVIIPEREEKRFFHWMENIRPWCISRQLWWGHRIPVWYCDDCGQQTCGPALSAAEGMTDPTVCAHCGSKNIRQDEDVLDTWFSSGLWPFSTLGWPDTDAPDYRRYYPTDVRETAYEILFFWVAREMMLGIELTGQTPYALVYLHGLVRTGEGKKVSKSMEDIYQYDPLNVIEKYGCDALRYTQLTSSTPGVDMSLDLRRLEGARNFTNKIWQAARFVLSNLQPPISSLQSLASNLQLPDRWILSRLNRLIQTVDRLFETYQYGEAGRQVYDFLWGEYCDWYIEACKVRLYDDTADKRVPRAVLLHVLATALKLLHPFMPFVTEALWQALPAEARDSEALIVARWPEADAALLDDEAEARMTLMMEQIRGIRNLRAEYAVPPGKRISGVTTADDDPTVVWLKSQYAEFSALAKLDPNTHSVQLASDLPQPPRRAVTVVTGDVVSYLPLDALVDLDAERERLSKDLADLEARIAHSEGLLAGDFAQKAPAAVVQREREKLADLQTEQAKLKERLGGLA